MSDNDLFTTYEQLKICHRVEVTIDNLHILAQHFGGTAVYTEDPNGDWQTKKPHLIIPGKGTIEIGAWTDKGGSRWNAEPLSQGWHPEGTYQLDSSETTSDGA